ncbi:MAG: hypothetical protein ACRD0A_20440 [Acidimicrobiales bacterium]
MVPHHFHTGRNAPLRLDIYRRIYLGLVAARHEAELARAINYSQLALPDDLPPQPPDATIDEKQGEHL